MRSLVIYLCSVMLLINHVNLFGQTAKDITTREGFVVTYDVSQENQTIKEVIYNATKNNGESQKLLNNIGEQVDGVRYYLDEKNRLWDINTSRSTIAWCNDPLTFGFLNRVHDIKKNNKVVSRRSKIFLNFLNGFRFVFEPNFGPVFNAGENKFTLESFATVPKIGFETNLFQSWVALQFVVFYPGTIEFDDQSPAITYLNNGASSSNSVDVDYGFAGGLAFFDGVLVVGLGKLNYDDRDFNSGVPSKTKQDHFVFVNIQAISAIRKTIAAIKE